MQKILTISNAKHFGISDGNLLIGRFPGGEISLNIKDNLKDSDVIVVGSTNSPAENLLELLLTIDTSVRAGAKKVTALIPYFAYARADREKFPGDAISAGTIAKLLESVGGNNFKVITIDVHSERMQSFFKVPFESYDVSDLFLEKFKGISNLSIIAPDKGAELKAREFAKKIDTDKIAILQKERLEDGSVIINGIAGDTTENIVMLDDIVDSGGTILKGAEFLKLHKASKIYVAVTHMVWHGGGFKLLSDSDLINKIYTTDTVEPPADIPSKIEIIPILPILEKITNG